MTHVSGADEAAFDQAFDRDLRPPGVPGSWDRPSPRLVTLRRVQVLTAAVPVAALTAVLLLLLPIGPVWLALVAVPAAGALGVETLLRRRARSWGYREREDDLLVRRGLIVRRLSVVPYGRMQFVDVTAGPFDRRFELATVHLHTAAAASDARIPGLALPEAHRLRDRLAALGEARAAGL